MTRHVPDGCPRCEAARRARTDRLDEYAAAILNAGDTFWQAHPEIVSAEHAYTERMRQGGASS